MEEFNEVRSVLSKSVEVYDSELEDELAELLAESPDPDEPTDSAKTTPTKPQTDLDAKGTKKSPDVSKELSALRIKGDFLTKG